MGEKEYCRFHVDNQVLLGIAQKLHSKTLKQTYLFSSLMSSPVQKTKLLPIENTQRCPQLILCSQLFHLCFPLNGRSYSLHLLLLLEYYLENGKFPNVDRYFSLWNFKDTLIFAFMLHYYKNDRIFSCERSAMYQ